MSSINLSWDADGTIDSYTIYRSESPMSVESLPAPLAENVLDKTYSDTTVVTGTTYYYRVASVANGAAKVSDEVMIKAQAVDEYWDNVVALLHFDDINESTTINDIKTKIWTAAGGAKISTNEFKFGGSSLSLVSSGSYVRAASSSDFGFGLGEFTIEAWVYLSSLSSVATLFDFRPVGEVQGAYPLLHFTSNGAVEFVTNYALSPSVTLISSDNEITTNVWTHVAASRKSNVLSIFVGGDLVASTADNVNYAPSICTIGRSNYTGYPEPLTGYIDEFRVTKGVARYTENFTPPDAPFPSS